MQVKLCKKCNTVKPASAFSVVRRKYKDSVYLYLQTLCKPCVCANWVEYREKNRATIASKKKNPMSNEELNEIKTPIWWEAFKGKTTVEQHKEYPVHSCGRKYLSQLGCIWCNRILNVSKTH